MIIFTNLTGARLNRDEELEAVKSTQGTLDQDGQPFEIIEVRHRVRSPHPLTIKGYQNTRIIMDQDGKVTVRHDAEGNGNLRFVANKFRDRIAMVAKTPWNTQTLIKSYRDNTFLFVDAKVGAEIKKLHEEWWAGISEDERAKILKIEEERKLTPHQVPPDYGQRENIESENMIGELAKLKEENRKLAEALKGKDHKVKTLEIEKDLEKTEPEAEVEQEETLDTKDPAEESALKHLKFFKLQQVARKIGITVDPTWKSEELVTKIMEVGLTKERLKQIIEG